MQVGLTWLKDYVDIDDLAPEAIALRLTMAGLEVETVERKTAPFSGVVVAKILSIKPHPQADKLSLCDVTDGDTVYSVVCGAPNIRTGDIVPLAKKGAILPGGITIKETMIRGQLSYGMVCSEAELGIGTDRSGVMILSREVQDDGAGTGIAAFCQEETPVLGEQLNKALAIDDVIFTISVTPNRPDCLSVIGIGREIAALTGRKLKIPESPVPENEIPIEGVTSITISDPDLCPRYVARIVQNVRIKPSPLWIRLRLESAGLRAINNVVDVTNFVMLEMGQPLHAFDFRDLEEGRIVVRRSREGEVFTTLDGKERILKPGIILICDGAKPVAIGGIMGGINTEVKEDTETVLIESAYFSPQSIRRSAKWLGMSTDASFRFERGVDPEGLIKAEDRAAQLIAGISGGLSCRGLIDQYPLKITTAKDIPLQIRRVRDLSGADIAASEICPILESLEMKIVSDDHGNFRVTPPTFRVDMEREIDLIEEIVRIRGYDSIPETLPVVTLEPLMRGKRRKMEERIREVLAGRGYFEAINYSFISPHWMDSLNIPERDERRSLVYITNPLTEDQSVMRSTLLCGLLETMIKNANTGSFDLKLFELGKVFLHSEIGELPKERNHLACLLSGSQEDEEWYGKRDADFYDLKGTLEGVFSDLMIREIKFEPGECDPFLAPGRSARLAFGRKYAGFIGEIRRDVMDKLELKNTAYVFEIDLDILSEVDIRCISYREISKYPSIVRDVAFLITKEIDADRILDIIHEKSEELLENVRIFDVYDGRGIPVGMRSLGLRFTYRSSEKTLTDDIIAGVHGRIVERIIAQTGARVRA